MNDHEKLWTLLKAAMNEALERRAGLPRVTIYDRPRRRKVSRRKRERCAAMPFPIQYPLPLYGRRGS